MQRISIAKACAALLILLVIGLASAAAGIKIGQYYQSNLWCCGIESRARNVVLSTREAFGLAHYYGQIGQDKWVTQVMFPGIRDGYFVDVGSADGTHNSNTKALEQLGWRGICIDPFPKNMQDRTCQMFRDVVYHTTGEHVTFELPSGNSGDEGGSGAIVDRAAPGARTMDFTTVSLADILDRAHAPAFINYISMDIEGAELEALRGFAWATHTVGAWTIEHNFAEPRRSEIRELLASHGYQRVHTWMQDDFYARMPQ